MHPPLAPEPVAPLDWADAAPGFADNWTTMRTRLRNVLRRREAAR